MMRKLVGYLMTLAFTFQLFITPTYALNNEEVKMGINDYANELESLKGEVIPILEKLDDWSTDYGDTLKSITKKNFVLDLTDFVSQKKYEEAFNHVISTLSSEGYIEASNNLSNIKVDCLTVLDKVIDYEFRLRIYLNTNKSVILLSDTLPLLDVMRSTYSDTRNYIKNILETYYDVYYQYVENRLTDYTNMSVTDLKEILDTWTSDALVYKNYVNSINNVISIWKQLMVDFNMVGLGFEDLLLDDIRPYIQKARNLFNEKYDDFLSKQWIELKNEGNEIVNSSFTTQEKNQKLLNKISYFETLKSEAESDFSKVKNNLEVNRILTKIENLETRVMTDCDEAITYLKSLLMLDDYDILVKPEATNQMILDSVNRYLIIGNEYKLDQFMNMIGLKGTGELAASNIYNNNVGTKSTVGVYEGNTAMILYHIILKGDIRANGIIDVSDVTYLIKTVLNKDTLNEYEHIAADMNYDNKLDISDITATIKKALS